MHWTNLYAVLDRQQLDARKTQDTEHNEASNPLVYLAEMFNDYDSFQPQNLMVQYKNDPGASHPVKVFPYKPSSSEWAYLATKTHELEPTNMTRKHILRDAGWIKSHWTEARKQLHLMYLSYERSGKHDAQKDDWGSEAEYRRWAKQAEYRIPGNNAVIRYVFNFFIILFMLLTCFVFIAQHRSTIIGSSLQ